MSEPKYCEDCRWFHEGRTYDFCTSPRIKPQTLVKRHEWRQANDMRREAAYGLKWCGPAADWFESKDVPKSGKSWWQRIAG